MAHVVDELGLCDSSAPPAPGAADAALRRGIVSIIWRCATAGRRNGAVALTCTIGDAACAGDGELLKGDGITEKLVVHYSASLSELEEWVEFHFEAFTAPSGGGALLLLLACLLSRGLCGARFDGDDESRPLIEAHFEVVNLLLFGHGHSNAFDGQRDAGGVVLRGAPRRPRIGLLAAEEARGLFTVGDFLKGPERPIWIISSDSHFSVLWQTAAGAADAHRAFDVAYWDPLAASEAPVRLTVDPAASGDAAALAEAAAVGDPRGRWGPAALGSPTTRRPLDDACAPALLDAAIRTRWPNAGVDWHGGASL
ncbi:hypothetical protein M885DRAFT_434011 [Pelagophyceae sp. CCMP2097]|nr:hypothetical protein M885DRAFT_434011 [Pelagophyceae sp. CCMP2097]